MKRGLVIGKFMPVHHGHIALINFASAQCDELIVSMSFTPHDPIDHNLRFAWISEIFKDVPNVKLNQIPDNFDDESLPLTERTRLWAAAIQKIYPPIDIVFSSENYGEPFANNLGAQHKLFDIRRKQNPVSATQIRSHPFAHWSFIPAVVRPFFVKKVCFFGPESTGKSSLAISMAKRYQTDFVPEVAREMITVNDFTVDDIIAIGQAQTKRVHDKTRTANKLLFCDTDLITTQIYSQHYLNTIPDILFQLENEIHYDLYFLMDIDTPWIADGLRDLGDRRDEMYTTFRKELDKRNIPYILIQGRDHDREDLVAHSIDKLVAAFS